jgi:hypothetical protein
MQTDLYVSYYLTELGRSIIIEGDGISVWAYLLKDDEETVDFGGFLCATAQPVEDAGEIDRYVQEGHQPPLHIDYANDYSVVEGLTADEIAVDALSHGRITISIRKQVYLIIDLEERQAYSIAVSQDGPYGRVLGG